MGRKKDKKVKGTDKKSSERLKLRREVLYTLADENLKDVVGGAGCGETFSACWPTR